MDKDEVRTLPVGNISAVVDDDTLTVIKRVFMTQPTKPDETETFISFIIKNFKYYIVLAILFFLISLPIVNNNIKNHVQNEYILIGIKTICFILFYITIDINIS
jgi:hypothetical protein